MLDMMERLAFEWLGAFIFSPEEGAPASTMPNQVSRRTATRRHEAVMQLQADITERFNQRREGRQALALVEEFDAASGVWKGRGMSEAPEVDGCLLIQPDARLRTGQFTTVTLERAALYDMNAVVYPSSPSKRGG